MSFGDKFIIKLAIGCIALGLFLLVFSKGEIYNSHLPVNSNKLGDLGSFISGTVGVIWSLVGVLLIILTLQLQRKELINQRKEMRTTSQANKQIAEDTKANAIVDLYQTYTNDYFFKLFGAAWKVLLNCLGNRDYSVYIISTFFVSEYRYEISDDTKKIIYEIYKNEQKDDSEEERKPIIKLELEDRHRLEDFINFYSILALRDGPKEVFEQCDFFSDWWRPLLWWICDKRWAAYINDERKRKYSIKPHHLTTLKRLNLIYGMATIEDTAERWKEFKEHPIVRNNKFDIRHNDSYLEY